MNAQNDPAVRRSAPAQLAEADRVLSRAEEMWARGGKANDVSQLVYVGRSQVQAARTMAAYEEARLDMEASKRRYTERQRQIDAQPTLESGAASPVVVRAQSSADGSVEGTLINNSQHPVTDVELMVRHAWLWKNEFHPGEESPGRVEYFQIAEQIPPGGSVRFDHRPAQPLPLRQDGHFETSLQVVGFEEVHY